MMKFKFAFVFLIVLVMYLQQSQGHALPKKATKLVAAKVAVAKGAAAKIKLIAFKKWLVLKAIAKAPFVLGKKAALLKIGAIKSLAAFKLAKAKGALGLASKKVEAIGTVTKKVGPAVAVISAIPAAAVASLPAIAAIPAAAVAAFPAAVKPLTDLVTPSKPEEEEEKEEEKEDEVTEAAIVPVRETHFQIVPADVHYSSEIVNPYNEHGYSVSLLPSGEYSNVYEYYPPSGVKYDTVVAAERVEGNQAVPSPQTDTEAVAPHDIYGVPN